MVRRYLGVPHPGRTSDGFKSEQPYAFILAISQGESLFPKLPARAEFGLLVRIEAISCMRPDSHHLLDV